jgi:hypothetical protein
VLALFTRGQAVEWDIVQPLHNSMQYFRLESYEYILLTECSSGISKNRCLRNDKRKCTCTYVSILIFWNVLRVLTLIEIFCLFVVIVLSSIVILTQNGQFLSCATVAFGERYG